MYDTKRKEWLHDTEHAVSLFGETIMLGELWCRPDDTHVALKDMNDIVAMQFTGLLDKNGKEIYERDIVERQYGTTKTARVRKVVEWCTNWKSTGFNIAVNPRREIEVVGNIYQNPELLK